MLIAWSLVAIGGSVPGIATWFQPACVAVGSDETGFVGKPADSLVLTTGDFPIFWHRTADRASAIDPDGVNTSRFVRFEYTPNGKAELRVEVDALVFCSEAESTEYYRPRAAEISAANAIERKYFGSESIYWQPESDEIRMLIRDHNAVWLFTMTRDSHRVAWNPTSDQIAEMLVDKAR